METKRPLPLSKHLTTLTAVLLTLTVVPLRAQDTTPPVISGVPADVTVECSSVPTAATPTATDDTDPNPTISLNETTTQSTNGCGHSNYTLTRTWTAMDSSGNSSSATQVITVHDTTAPVISYVPANATVECSAVPAPPTVVLNCTTNTTPAQLLISDGTPGGTIIITDQGTNDGSAIVGEISYNGPVGSGWSIDITTALTAPAPGGGSSIQPTMILNTLNVGSGTLTIEFSANGFCANGVMQSQVGGISGGSVQFKTWVDTGNTNFGMKTLVQNFGPFSSGSFSSNKVTTVSPDLPYSITLQTVINHPTSAVSQFTSQVGVFVPTATDTCDSSPTLTYGESSTQTPSGIGHDNYTITRTWTASDACGNTSSAQQVLTVHDTTAPVITGVPANMTVECNAVPGAATPTATDNCTASPTINLVETTTQTTNGCGHFSYTLHRTWTASDATGNTSTAQQTIVVHDTTPPVLSEGPADITVQCDNVSGAAILTATDNCDTNAAVTLTEVSNTGACSNSYVLTRTWVASDACGNSSSYVQHVTVIDTSAPVLAGVPADVTVQCDAVPTVAAVTATDNCDGAPTISLSQSTVAGSCGGSYVLTRTWVASDVCGNSSSASQQITVIDTTSPVLVGVPPDATVDCNAVPTVANVTATDNCDTNASISFASYSTQTPTGPGHDTYILKRKWTATDSCGNSSTATQILTVAPIAPVITGFPADVTYSCSSEVPAADDNLISATDPCAGDVVYVFHDGDVVTNLTCANQYDIARTYHVTNVCGITASRTQHITVRDTTPPVISGYPADATLNCMCDLPPANDTSITASDNCSTVTVTHSADVTNNFVDSLNFDLERTYTATDVCGNQTSHTQIFHMALYAPPFVTITGAPDIVVSNANYVAHGTAGGTFPVTTVYYSLNGAAYQPATGTANWSASLHLVPGTNTLAAYAMDNHSLVSTTAVATIFYSITSKLIIQIRDGPVPNRVNTNAGFVVPNLDGQYLEVGRNYTITAFPLGPHRFVGWCYSPALNVAPFETNATLTFTMQPNLKLIARFENPFYHLKGTWGGLFSEPTPDLRSAGFISITLPPAQHSSNVAYYSGRILLDGTKYTFNYPDGHFDPNGHSHLVVPRTGKSSMTIDMDIDVVTYTGDITGTITTPEWTANLRAHRAWTNVGNAEFRRYTMAFPAVSGPTPSPNGWGVGATTNAPGGLVHFLGFAADGAQINTPLTYVSENLEYPFYGQLYGTSTTGYQGSMWGWLTFSKDQPGVTGTVYWWRPAGIATASYTAGFSNVTEVIGSPYTNFPSAMSEFGWTGSATISVFDNINLALGSTASVDNNSRITVGMPNTNLFGLHVTTLNGLINGTFLEPLHKKIDPQIHGVILQNAADALGFYVGTNAGAFTLTQP